MVKKSCIVIGVIFSLMVVVGCAKKTVREEPLVTGTGTVEGKPAEEAAEAEKPGIEEESLEASLERKEYPGIEGEVLESSLLKNIHFGFDRYDLTSMAREILSQNAEVLLKNPGVTIQIEGHCDERGTIEYNLALGERRANATKQYLISLGVSKDRLETISYGEEMPVDPGHNEEAWAKNRRAHFIILSM